MPAMNSKSKRKTDPHAEKPTAKEVRLRRFVLRELFWMDGLPLRDLDWAEWRARNQVVADAIVRQIEEAI